MPNKDPGPLKGKKVIFQTLDDPMSMAQYGGPGRVALVLPGATAEDVAKLKANGYDEVGYWDPNPSADTATQAKNLGVTIVVLQAEGPGQHEGSNAAAAGLAGSGVTIGLVTNNYMDQYPDYVDVAMPEAYPDTPGMPNVPSAIAASVNRGAPPTIMPVIGGDARTDGQPSINPQQAAIAARYGGYGIFPPNIDDPEAMNAMLEPPISGPSGQTAAVDTPLTGSGNQPGQSPKKKKGLWSRITGKKSATDDTSPPDRQEQPLGIQGQHDKAGTEGAPAAYRGGAPIVDNPQNPNDTFSFTDKKGRRNTITTTASGAKIQQVEGETAYQIKKPDPVPTNPNQPAWRQNPDWGDADKNLATKAGLDSSKVLEQRPGANGNTVFRLADGTYKSFNPTTGQSTDAGTWNNQQWQATQGGTTNPPDTAAAINNGSPAATDASSSGPNYGITPPPPPADIPPPMGGPPQPPQ